jgi:hypothetical protein
MNWGFVKDIFVGPEGPMVLLGALIFLNPNFYGYGNDSRRWSTAALFTFVALKILRHFEFSLSDQYEITVALYVAIVWVLPKKQ